MMLRFWFELCYDLIKSCLKIEKRRKPYDFRLILEVPPRYSPMVKILTPCRLQASLTRSAARMWTGFCFAKGSQSAVQIGWTAKEKKNGIPRGIPFSLEVPPRFELGIEVLQTFALPLGYGTECPYIIPKQIRFVKSFYKVYLNFFVSFCFFCDHRLQIGDLCAIIKSRGLMLLFYLQNAFFVVELKRIY